MNKPTLLQQIKSCIKAGIISFDGENGKHDIFCPGCKKIGDEYATSILYCMNENCRVERFLTE